MLVNLPSKKIAETWDTFREIIRRSIPTDPAMLPDRLQRMLYAALTGRLQCWLLYEEDGSDDFYGGIVTRTSIDDLTGQKSLLIYALATFKQASRAAREADFISLKRVAREWGCQYVTAYCESRLVAETTIKANKGQGRIVSYIQLPTNVEEA